MKKNKEKLIWIIMRLKLILIALLFSVGGLYASVKAQNERVDVKMTGTLDKLFELIEQQTHLRFVYNQEDIKDYHFDCNEKNVRVEDILTHALSDKGLRYEFVKENIVISKKVLLTGAQQPEMVKIKGIVKDSKNNPIPGATVLIKGTSIGVSTAMDGTFKLDFPKSDKKVVLVISFVGMKSQEVEYKGQESISIQLEDEVSEMEEVVVTGYFERKKESYTGATSTFKGDDLKKISTGNILSTLSSLDPSFTLVTNNEMGSDPNTIPEFTIRGAGSLKSEYEGSPNTPTFILDGFEVSAEKIFDLDPNRVQSITILKDAAATSIYGSRAANGVVVIETKVPKSGALQTSYNGSVDLEVADLSDYDLMNSKEKFEFEQNCGLYKITGSRPEWDERTLLQFNAIQKLVSRGIDTDWKSIPVKDVGIGQKHSLNFEGGDNRFRYNFSLNYSNKMGVMRGSQRDGLGLGIRLQYNYRKFKFMSYTSYDNVKSKNSPYGNFSQYTYFNPYYYPYNEDGSVSKILYEYTYYDRGFTTKTMYNGLYNTTLNCKDESKYNDFIENFSIEYDIIDGLKFKSQISINNKQSRSDIFKPKEHIDFVDSDYKGSYTLTNTEFISYDINAVLSFTKSIGKHQINAVGIYNSSEKKVDSYTTKAINFPNDYLDHIGMGSGYITGSKPIGSYDITRLIGFVGNLNYGYDNRYLLDASIRSDASSLFGSNNRWGTFGSVGVAWNIQNEWFIKESNAIGLLKLRGSWGLTGGQNFYAYQALTMLSYTDSSINGISYDDQIGAVAMGLGNSKLKWQRSEKLNLGLDFELFQRRISGYINLYSEKTKDALVNVTIAPSLGFNSYVDNLGEVQNSGTEVNLRINAFKTHLLSVDLFGSIVHNKNKLLKINNALTEFNKEQDSNSTNKNKVRYMEGKSINTIWVNESVGIDPRTGKEVFKTLSGDYTSKWSSENYKPYGSTDPIIYGNLGFRLMLKNFELNTSFMYSYGGSIYNSTLVDKVENIDPNENGDKRILKDRWQKEGDVAKYVGYDPNNPTYTYPTSRFVEKENYIQLRSLNMSYFWQSKLLENIGVQMIKLSFIGNDIFRTSTIKMERGISYPFARTYSFALQLKF